MNENDIKELRKRWNELSTVCFCREGILCSACREQDSIAERAKQAGWNLWTMKRGRM